MGTAGLILGIAGGSLLWVPGVNLLCAALAIIFGWAGLNRVMNGTADNKGAAVTGIALGTVSFAAGLLFIIVFIGVVSTTASAYLP
jgi:TRAP-type C4-dicarboxylate transport system permease small subunit